MERSVIPASPGTDGRPNWGKEPAWQAEASNNSLTTTATQFHYLHTDHLGTPMMATDAQGSTTWKTISEAFGATKILPASAITMNLRFPGQYYDQENGRHYNFHRYYSASIGRYVQSDPLGVTAGINSYLYASNSPNNHIDPFGLMDTTCCEDKGRHSGIDFEMGCCQKAAAAGWMYNEKGEPIGGAVICCSGEKVACLSRQYEWKEGINLIRACSIEHEKKHFEHVDCNGCKLDRPEFKPTVLKKIGECEAYRVSIACLQRSKDKCNGNPACIANIDKEIAYQINEIYLYHPGCSDESE